MAMTVQIDCANGATPTWTGNVTAIAFSRVDDVAGVSAQIPTPEVTGTNFSFVKSLSVNITVTGSLSMTNIKVGKASSESVTGTKLWHYTGHASGSYVEATAAPTTTGDNNVTAPTLNGGTATALPAIGSASQYSAGPHSTTGRKGNLAEIVTGIDFTNVTAGPAVAIPSISFRWTEG
jgi:hypothetical protein